MNNAKRSFGPYRGQPGQKRSQQPYLIDRKLAPRVKEFLRRYEDQSQADVDDVLHYLVVNFQEYARKKRNSLRQSVLKILNSSPKDNPKSPGKSFEFYQQRQNMKGRPTFNNGDGADEQSSTFSSDDEEELVEAKDLNMINNSMHQIYSKVARGTFSTPIYVDSPSSDRPEEQSTSMDVKNDNFEALDLTSDSVSYPVKMMEEKQHFQNDKGLLKERLSNASTPLPSPIGSKAGKSDDDKQKQNRVKKKKKDETEKAASSKQTIKPSESTVKLSDVGGYESSLEEVIKLLFHLKHPEVFQRLGVKPPRGFLLHGPPGCGKTLLANAIAGELQLPYFRLAATEVISGVSGESEEKLREIFITAQASAPSIIFLDEIDAIAPSRETASKEMEKRIVSQLLVCMDDLNRGDADVLIIGATNRPDSLDPALRRAGRFDREVCLGIPDKGARERILKVVCDGLRLSEDFQFDMIASLTPGFVGADLVSLSREAAMCAVQRIFDQMERDTQFALSAMEGVEDESKSQNEIKAERTSELMMGAFSWLRDQPPLQAEELNSLYIEMNDFKNALTTVQPSAKREGFATVPDVTWQDIGALENVRDELSLAVLAPVRHFEEFSSLGISNPPGILLAGPPGCGKTLLAKAIANEAGINFISVKGPELLNMYVGESEKAVRQVFQRARNSAPCVIFFDEIDALCPKRSDIAESSASSRVVNQLLTEMDGLETRKQVFLMGATNRPDIIDPAILRPGRLDKILFVGLPSSEDRVKILQTITKFGAKPKLATDVNLELIGNDPRCERFSGADLAALVREASVQRLRDLLKNGTIDSDHGQEIEVMAHHFEQAFEKLRPSVSVEDTNWYERLKTRFEMKPC